MKKIALILLINLFITLLFHINARSAIITEPSSINISHGFQTKKVIIYKITTPGCYFAISNSGIFISGQTVLGIVNTVISANLTGTSNSTTGNVFETLVIPIQVIKKAEQLRVNKFEFKRNFNYNCQVGVISETTSIPITLTSEATAEFSINRLQLYFENRRAEITVKRNQPGLKAYADLRYVGSGLLQGYWEVDGRILSYVNNHLVYGRSVTLESPDIPALPTIVPGTHIVKLIITNPPVDIAIPEAVYFVTAEEYKKIFSITLIYPEDKSNIDYVPPNFRWEGKDQTVTYLIEFLEDVGEKPIFSAYIKKPNYTIPDSVFRNIFSEEKSYLWRVKGFDVDNNIVGESPVFRFSFRQRSSFVPGHIIMLTENSSKTSELIEGILRKYNLRLIETYDIKALFMKVAVFQTEENIFRLIDNIAKEEGVFLAQPNYIYRTISEPMIEMQNIYRILNLKKLHEYYRGREVKVAIIDTGVDIDHRDLKDRILFFENLISDERYRAEIHGTAVAGIIGASLNGFGITGIAPESEIMALRACRQVNEKKPEGECYTSSISKAIDLAIERKAKVINMSFGSTSPDKFIKRLIEEGVKKGSLFIAPGGNMPRQKELTFPASHPDVISVAGLDESGNFYPNRDVASKAMVLAPCTNLLTTFPENKHNFLSGTSLSSATITGILTLAVGKDKALVKDKIPPFKGYICKWEEDLLNLPLCEK